MDTTITSITVTNTILAGNLGDLGLDTDDCRRIADLTEAAIAGRLAEEYPGVPCRITSDVRANTGGVGGGIVVEMWEMDDDLGEMPSAQGDGLRDILTDISNRITEDFCEAKA